MRTPDVGDAVSVLVHCFRRWGRGARAAASWKFALAGMIVALVAFGAPAAMAGKAKHVLVLYANNRLLPATIEGDRGLLESLTRSDPGTQLSAEFLDYPRFDGEAYYRAVIAFLREKYLLQPPDVIVAGGGEALDFVLRNRAALFSLTPVVHMGVDQLSLRSMPPLPADVVGVPVDYDFFGTIEQALRWHPKARRLVLVTGAAATDRDWESRLRGNLSRLKDRVTVEFLAGLPTGAVLNRLGQLGKDAVVFTPGYFQDGEGRGFAPREAARIMAAAATAPIYAPFNTFIGVGVVGGRMPSYEMIGRQAGDIVSKLLDGATPASLRLPEIMPQALTVDWRQLQRWGVGESQVPGDAVVYFKEPTLWQAYPSEAITVIVLFLILSGLVAGLLIERHRRRAAELAEAKHRNDLARAARFAIAGELTGSIAHEINQPLGAILSNVAAAALMLESGADRRDELRAILSDIRRDDLRASEVIRRLRTLFSKHEFERRPFKVDEVVSDVANILRAEAQRRRIILNFRQVPTDAIVSGDRIEIGQMLLNLILNAMDAVADAPEDRRTIMVSADRVANGVMISVRDRGHGIAPEQMPRLFDSFFTTKREGIGLGLSIVRAIVAAHDGLVWAENGPGDGAIFRVELPVLAGAKISSLEAA